MLARHALLSLSLFALMCAPNALQAQAGDDFLDSYFGQGAIATDTEPTDTGVVALLWEADSYTPPGYEGRSLPSAGSKVSLWAIPHLGGGIAPEQLVYTWKLNGATLATQSGRGKSSVTINAPELFGAYTVSVEVASSDRAVRGSALVRIESVEPVARLYAEHPLFGLQFWNAIGSNAFVSEREMTFVALPFFASITTPDDALLRYTWRVDRRSIAPNPARPSSVTVSAEEGGAVATLDVVISHMTNFLMESRGAWQITLGAGAGAGVFDPFRTSTL